MWWAYMNTGYVEQNIKSLNERNTFFINCVRLLLKRQRTSERENKERIQPIIK